MQAHYRDYGKMTYARCVFVIHNMAHQGRGPFEETKYLELNDTYKEMFRWGMGSSPDLSPSHGRLDPQMNSGGTLSPPHARLFAFERRSFAMRDI